MNFFVFTACSVYFLYHFQLLKCLKFFIFSRKVQVFLNMWEHKYICVSISSSPHSCKIKLGPNIICFFFTIESRARVMAAHFLQKLLSKRQSAKQKVQGRLQELTTLNYGWWGSSSKAVWAGHFSCHWLVFIHFISSVICTTSFLVWHLIISFIYIFF